MAVRWVYFMTNRPNGTLYVGVTDDLIRRTWEHREGVAEGFTKRDGLKRLVHFEQYEDIRDARQRERNVKHYPRAWKVRLILLNNRDGMIYSMTLRGLVDGRAKPGHKR